MKYSVIKHFTDLQDNNYKYREGSTYPREGYEPSAERIEELSTDKNRLKTPLIVPEIVLSDEEEQEETAAEAVADVAAEEAVEEDVPDMYDEDNEEKPKKRNKRKIEE